MDKNSLSHTSWECVYHIVWISKYRRKVLYGEARREIGEILGMLVERMDGVEKVGGQRLPGPHTHLPQDRAEAQREQRGGEAEGQERDHPAREASRVEEADGQGPDAMGEGLLREHRRP